MEQPIGRLRVARAYVVLIALTPLTVIIQGILFAAFYSEGGKKGFIDAHAVAADISLLVVVLIITPLAFLARFRRSRRIGWLSPNPPMRSGLGVGTRGEGRGTRRSALDSDKWGRWRPLVGVGGADGGPGQRRWGGVGGTACKGRQSRTGPVRLCGVVE